MFFLTCLMKTEEMEIVVSVSGFGEFLVHTSSEQGTHLIFGCRN